MVVKLSSLYDLETVNSAHREWVGEKAIALSQLLKEGYPILPGIVVGRQVLRSLFEEVGGLHSLSELNLDLNDYESLQQVAQELSQKIDQVNLPQKWCEEVYQKVAPWNSTVIILRPSLIVPSSENYAYSLLESSPCFCNTEEIAKGLKKVWKSLFRGQSLFYWQQQGIPWEELGLAIIMQPMASAIASGNLNLKEQQWQIQAVQGLGYSLVRGEVLPEIYEINPTTKQVQLHQLGYQTRIYHLNPLVSFSSLQENGKKAILTSQQLSRLIEIADQLQRHTDQNIYCEWTWLPESNQDGEKSTSGLYLTQFSIYSPASAENTMSVESTSPVIVKGIASAKGRATGKVYILGRDDEKTFPPGAVLVAKSLNTENLSLIKLAGGLVMESGGMTSHGAILARELNIPAVVGVKEATDILQQESEVTVDGDKGEVLRPSQGEKPGDEENLSWQRWEFQGSVPLIATELMINLSQRDRATAMARLPVDGVGLLRSELMLLDLLEARSLSAWLSVDHRDDLIDQLASFVGQFAEAFFPRPVFYRSTDWLSVQEKNSPSDRGTYSYVKNSDFFSAQMFALRHLQDQGYSNINLILPFVRSVEEVEFCKTLLTEIGVKKSCQLWMMAEVPSVVYLLSEYVAAGIEGIAIGTNDLTQFLLGVNREEEEGREQYNECHPAMLKLLRELIEKAKAEKIPCSVCGQGVVLYPKLLEDLVRWGITGVSVEASAIETVYSAIARSERRILLEAARKQLDS